MFPEFRGTKAHLSDRSFVQAWFMGAQIDIGGSAKKYGLSLYPLQWMLTESRGKGLVLEFSAAPIIRNKGAKIDNPLHVAFPEDA